MDNPKADCRCVSRGEGVVDGQHLSVYAPPMIAAKLSKTETWVDGLVGGQVRSNITDRVFASAIGFAGTGGSKFIGDLYAGVGYQFNKKWDAFVGYRVQYVTTRTAPFSTTSPSMGPCSVSLRSSSLKPSGP